MASYRWRRIGAFAVLIRNNLTGSAAHLACESCCYQSACVHNGTDATDLGCSLACRLSLLAAVQNVLIVILDSALLLQHQSVLATSDPPTSLSLGA